MIPYFSEPDCQGRNRLKSKLIAAIAHYHSNFLITDRLKSNLDLPQLGMNETELKANLYFHIGNPIKRWKIERVIPVKLILQLFKTVFLVLQVYVSLLALEHDDNVLALFTAGLLLSQLPLYNAGEKINRGIKRMPHFTGEGERKAWGTRLHNSVYDCTVAFIQ